MGHENVQLACERYLGTEEDARIDKASLNDVYSLRVRTRLTTRVHVQLVYIPSSVDDYWRISCPGRELADFVELSRGFFGPPQYSTGCMVTWRVTMCMDDVRGCLTLKGW